MHKAVTEEEALLLVDKREAARILTISTRHLDALVTRGLLPRVKLGSACRFRISDIRAMVDRLAGGTPGSSRDK